MDLESIKFIFLGLVGFLVALVVVLLGYNIISSLRKPKKVSILPDFDDLEKEVKEEKANNNVVFDVKKYKIEEVQDEVFEAATDVNWDDLEESYQNEMTQTKKKRKVVLPKQQETMTEVVVKKDKIDNLMDDLMSDYS
jgi:hypothetical protein